MAEPPVDVGAVQLTVADVLEAEIDGVPMVGAPGAVYGVILLDDEEYEPVPAAFVAATVNVYALATVRPVNVYDAELDPVDCVLVLPLASVAITEYPVMLLPLFDGAVHVRLAVVLLVTAVALTLVGVPGRVYGVTLDVDDEYEPVPAELKAATLKV